MIDLDQVYNERFFQLNTEDSSPMAAYMVPRLTDLLELKTVLDLGCARGLYVAAFMENGVTAIGLEGARAAVENPVRRATLIRHDLRKKLPRLRYMFDLILSIEVAEHIEPEYEKVYIDNLTKHFAPYIVMTAAPPGQAGECHINLKPKEYWVEKIEARSYERSRKIEAVISRWAAEARSKKIHIPYWFPQNLLVFRCVLGCVA